LLLHSRTRLALAEDVRLDVHEFLSAVRWVVGPDATFDKRQLGRAVAILQRGDLLPGWYDDWVFMNDPGWPSSATGAGIAGRARGLCRCYQERIRGCPSGGRDRAIARKCPTRAHPRAYRRWELSRRRSRVPVISHSPCRRDGRQSIRAAGVIDPPASGVATRASSH
jgi:hypothetical protein